MAAPPSAAAAAASSSSTTCSSSWPASALALACTAAASCAATALLVGHVLPRWRAQRREKQQQQQHQQQQHACTPEPPHTCSTSHYSTSSNSDSCLFSPVNARARADPFDTRPRANCMSWDDYFMALAFLSAHRSKDPNKQVGAVIVSATNIILGIGYNGFPRGCADSQLPWAKRAASGRVLDTKYPYVVHAEANALLNKNQAQVAGARIYVTLFPCNECAKLLIQAGISEVVFNEAKLEPTGQRPGTMEAAAAADADPGDDAVAACSQMQPQPQPAAAAAASAPGRRKEGGGVLDDSYIASRRLLALAGVGMRQHALRRTVCLGPKAP